VSVVTLDPSVAARIVSAVNAGFDRQLQFTADLVAHPSVRAHEQSAQDLLYDAMSERALSMDRWNIDPDQINHHPGGSPIAISYENVSNVVGTYTPTTHAGRSLILNGHVDVVPTGPENSWSRSPWDAQVVDGWMYGRGSGDMKAGLVANLFAFDAIRAAGYAPTAPIHMQSVVEEECTGNGSLSAFLRGYTADAVIIPEPEENMLVRANVGVIWFQVRVEGRPGHPREMDTGINAIDEASVLMANLRVLQDQWNSQQNEHEHFADVHNPINFNFGQIRGGDWPSSVPSWCEVQVRAAFYPGISADAAWSQLQECLRQSEKSRSGVAYLVERTGFFAEGYVLEEGSRAEATLAAAHQHAFGANLESFVTPGYLDGRVFSLYGGIPALVYGPISENIHGFDERVHVESVRRVTIAIALFIAEWCGVEPV
jgi:acetylornithine deacetylase